MYLRYTEANEESPKIKCILLSQWHLDNAEENELMATTAYLEFDRITEPSQKLNLESISISELRKAQTRLLEIQLSK